MTWGSKSESKSAPKTDHDSAAARAMKEQQSRQKFEESKRRDAGKVFETGGSNAPRSGPVVGSTRTGTSWDSKAAGDRTVQNLRRELNYSRMENRRLRQDQFYGNYYGRSPVFANTYHDPFGNMFFWLWLMDRPQQHRDEWIYHHRSEMDPGRYEELRQHDRDLDRRLAELEGKGIKRDASYTPPELKDNKDLVYGDDVVERAHKEANSSSFPWFWVVGFPVILLGVGYLGYLAIFKVRLIKA